MILIGQYDSPFVRRVGIALRLYGMPFEHRPWSTFGDGEKLVKLNPLRRVPTLVLDDGEVLVESHAILDHLDETVGPERALFPAKGAERRAALKVAALGTGLADKAVTLFYEGVFHKADPGAWRERVRGQVGSVLTALEADRASRRTSWWFGETMGHADIAVACAMRFVRDVHPGIHDPVREPALAAHSAQAEALGVFGEISQAFSPPA